MGGLLPEATDKTKGLMPGESYLYSNKKIQNNDSSVFYVKIASISTLYGEGIAQHYEAFIIGSNNYVNHPACAIVSILSHQKKFRATKNILIGSISLGYVNDGNKADLYVKCDAFNHIVRAILLSKGSSVSTFNEMILEKPLGWVDI